MWGHHDEAVTHQCVCVWRCMDSWQRSSRHRGRLPRFREVMAWTWLSSCVCYLIYILLSDYFAFHSDTSFSSWMTKETTICKLKVNVHRIQSVTMTLHDEEGSLPSSSIRFITVLFCFESLWFPPVFHPFCYSAPIPAENTRAGLFSRTGNINSDYVSCRLNMW